MQQLTPEQAEDYGLKLAPDQKDLLNRQYRYALIGQDMPLPDCGCGHERHAIGFCTQDHYERTKLLQPTVVELASPAEQAEIEAYYLGLYEEMRELGFYRNEGEFIQLPHLYGWAVDLSELGYGGQCGCLLEGKIGCECRCGYASGRGIMFSPYTSIPLSEEQAMAVLSAATKDLETSGYYPLEQLVVLECHGLEECDDIPCDEEGNLDEDAYADLIAEEEADLKDKLGVAPTEDGHLHLSKDGFRYEVPEQVHDELIRLEGSLKRSLSKYKSLFKRYPRTLRTEVNRAFAYPCVDSGD